MTDALSATPYVSAPVRSREQAALDKASAALKDMLRIARAASIGVSGNQPRIAKAEAALADIETLRQRPYPSDEPGAAA